MKHLQYFILPLILVAFGCKTYHEKPDLVDIRKFAPAAERGDALAQYHLGQAYASHWQYPEASNWYRKAALQGVPAAMYALGQNYLVGNGVPKNPVEAFAWFDIAASQNHIAARNARETLTVRMTHAETDAGTRRAAVLIREIPPQNLVYRLSTDSYNRNSESAVTPRTENLKGGEVMVAPTATVETPKPAKVQPAKPAIKSSSTNAPASSLHYGNTGTKGGMIQTAP